MYTGIATETGKTVHDEDTFSYACERCRTGDVEEKETFLEISRHAESMEDFAETLVEWFYSGNWTYKED